MNEVISQTAPEPVGAYPHARKVGKFLYLSGVGPRQKASTEIPGVKLSDKQEIIDYDVSIQTHAVIKNIELILKDAGASLGDLIDIQVFLTNMKADFAAFNKVYAQYFSAEKGPCRTTVEINSLPTPIAVEFKAIAYIS